MRNFELTRQGWITVRVALMGKVGEQGCVLLCEEHNFLPQNLVLLHDASVLQVEHQIHHLQSPVSSLPPLCLQPV